jgi:hypothetical protein
MRKAQQPAIKLQCPSRLPKTQKGLRLHEQPLWHDHRRHHQVILEVGPGERHSRFIKAFLQFAR